MYNIVREVPNHPAEKPRGFKINVMKPGKDTPDLIDRIGSIRFMGNGNKCIAASYRYLPAKSDHAGGVNTNV